MVKFAVIGTNNITSLFLEAAHKYEGFELVAVYSRSIQKAKEYAKEHGAKLYFDSLEELAKCSEVEAVYVASPNSLHCSQSTFLMEQGKHVLCEKTIASNSAELLTMLNCANDNNVILLEAMRPAFDPGIAAVKENLKKLGKIRRVTLEYCQYSSRYDNFKKGIIENAFNPKFSNGALMDIGVYCVHILVKLFGKPNKVQAMGVLLEGNIDGQGIIIASYDTMQAELVYSKITNSFLSSQIQGEEANMLIDQITSPKEIKIVYRDGKEEIITTEIKENNMYYELKEFIRLIENEENASSHNKYSIMELEIMDEARRQIGINFKADQGCKILTEDSK